MTEAPPTVIEVFADVVCPFTHLGLRRFVQHRTELRREDVRLWVRAWPLEVVNGGPLEPALVAEEVADLRRDVAPTSFEGFRADAFPATSLPALALAAAAYEVSLEVGEQVSLELRALLFERGVDISAPDVLAQLAAESGVAFDPRDRSAVMTDHLDGVRRGVIGSPHFFTPAGGFFCPSLDVSRDATGRLRVAADPERFDRFIESCFV